MNSNESRKLNPFEIKQEISRFANVASKSKILIDEEEFALLDSQENKEDIVKLLLKEFKRCNDNIMAEIKILLERYTEPEHLIYEMENILTDNESSNNLKLHAIEVLSHVNKNWHEEDYQQYLEYDEEKVFQDTKTLLKNSKSNPEIQLDFLDFLATIADADKYTLLEAMSEEQSGEDLANVLVPVFLSYMDSPIGIYALNLLKSTKSVYAYRSLSEIYDIIGKNLQPAVKKCITELKFSGADRVVDKIHDYTNGQFSFVPPDSDGNYCLFYEKKYIDNGDNKSDFFSVVANDYSGISECIGFIGISEFELSVFREKLLDECKDVEISPSMFKYFLHKAEKLTYETSAPPYEYNCWKQLFIDIPIENLDLDKILSDEYVVKKYTEIELSDIFEEDFTLYWFYSQDFSNETKEFFDFMNNNFKTNNLKNIDLTAIVKKGLHIIIDAKEREKWSERFLISSLYCHNKKAQNLAQILYSISKDEHNQEILYNTIIKYSIFKYFYEFQTENNYSIFTKNDLTNILKFLKNEWSLYV